MIQAAKKLDAIAEYGSILALSYVAAQRTFYGYNDICLLYTSYTFFERSTTCHPVGTPPAGWKM